MNPNKILIADGKVLYWQSGDLHTEFGVIKEEDLLKEETKVMSHTGKELMMMHASFFDKLQKINRGPQAMTEKDMGSILGYVLPEQDAKIVEVGVGSGKFTCVLSHCFPNAEIICYEKNAENIKIAQKNLDSFNVKNVTIKHADVLESFSESDVDVVLMDIPDAPLALEKIAPSVKNGGSIVSYLPSISQVGYFVEEADKNNVLVDRVIENIEREWHVEVRKVRPKSPGLLHTAFLVFARKL